MDWTLSIESALRLGAFASVLAVLLAWEQLAPRRTAAGPRGERWPNNLGVFLVGSLLVRALFPAAAVGAALTAAVRGWGLLNALAWPPSVEIVIAVVLLDFAIWAQHRVFHAVPVLWRLHRMHHTDTDFDVTTGLRFHPLELIVSMLIKFGAVALIGAPVTAVLVFEVLLNASSMFNHGNVRVPLALDRVLRWLIVTPDMHRVHHSWDPAETNSNFGFMLPWWDRLFRTYVGQPCAGHAAMTIGLREFRAPGELRLDRLLSQPFRHA